MSKLIQRLRSEVDLIERFTSTYVRKFEQMIERLNRAPAGSDVQCLRLCVEAVNMMMASQSQVARTLKALASDPAPARQAA